MANLLEILRYRVNLVFGCDKPGGRPLSPERIKEIPPAGVCQVKSKSGKTLYYKKPGIGSKLDSKEKHEQRLQNQTQKLATIKKGTKLHSLLSERVERTKKRIADIKKAREEIFRRVDEIPLDRIDFDPKRFQYKIIGQHTTTGEVGSLEGVVKFDPNLAGILQVWKDPDDGKTYVVNGHNRLALAKRAGADKIAVRYLDVGSAKEARAIGALTNIAEGRGTAIDSAKFFRDTGLGKNDLKDRGIKLNDRVAGDGLALASLPNVLFGMAVDGELELGHAISIGNTGFDEQKQYRLYELVKRQENKGRSITPSTITELAGLIGSSVVEKNVETDLFGDVETEEDSYLERANLQDMIKRRLSKDKRIFGVASRSAAALERAGNVIDADKSLDISREAAEHLKVFDEFKTEHGDLSNILNKASKQIKQAPNRKAREAIEDRTYGEIVAALPSYIERLGVKK